MSAEDYDRANEIFLNACDLDESERNAFLNDACGDDSSLRARIDAMLDMDAQSCDAIEFAAAGGVGDLLAMNARACDSFDAVTPKRLGDYALVRKIGEGGMGTVYEATQEHPQRTVALKVIRAGLTSGQLLDRFRREANLLGRLKHAGIAHIYDAGVGDLHLSNGATIEQPYFAMELVDGPTIDEYVKQKALTEREKLGLLIRVCDAVQHAHERGVIHRDLKPGNILVEKNGQPKILDFGVSRATDADVQAVTMQTDVGQLIGTIAYMSPEQALGDPNQIDPRSDVYALGVIGFEILSGHLPIPVRGHAIPEAARRIREEDPTRLSSINTRCRGDIDTMIQKALEKAPDRRYQTAGALAEDLRRYLRNEPIKAHPPSRTYQLGKFARRNRGLVAGVIGMIVILIAGIITTGTYAWEASAQRDEAQHEARRVAALNKFLVDDVFNAADPETGATHDLRVRDMLSNATRSLDSSFTDDPDIEALIRAALGKIFLTFNEFDLAEEHLQRAVVLNEKLHPQDPRKLVQIKQDLGRALQKNSKLVEASQLLNEVLSVQKRSRTFGDGDIASTIRGLGDIAYAKGDYSGAESLYRESMALYESSGEGSDQVVKNLMAIARALVSQDKVDESIALFREALAIETDRGSEDPLYLTLIQHNLGAALSIRGDFEESRTILEKALSSRRRILGDENASVAATLFELAKLAMDQEDYERALTIGEEALAIQNAVLHENHMGLAKTYNVLGYSSRMLRDYAKTERYARESYRIYRAVQGPESRATVLSLSNIADVLMKQEKYEEAIDVCRPALVAIRSEFGDDHSLVFEFQTVLGTCLTHVGQFAEAEQLLVESVDRLEQLNTPSKSWAKHQLDLLRIEMMKHPDSDRVDSSNPQNESSDSSR